MSDARRGPSGRRSAAATLLLACLPGLLLLAAAGRQAMVRRATIAAWPRVPAHVDSAAVVAWSGATRQTAYARRLWLSWDHDGRTDTRRLTSSYTGDWAAAARAADAARRAGTLTLIVNAAQPGDVTVDDGFPLGLYVWPALLGAAGILALLIGLGAGLSRVARDRATSSGGARRASARGPAVLAGAAGLVCLALAAWVGSAEVGRRLGWTPTTARVDSADVVQRTRDGKTLLTFAPRLWIAYDAGGRTVHRPVMTSAPWRTDRFRAEADGAAVVRAGTLRAFVRQADPLEATLDPTATGNLVIPVAFGIVGVVLLLVAARAWRAATPLIR